MQSVTQPPPPLPSAAPLSGLSESDAADRRSRGLGNSAPPPTSRSYRQIIVENVFTFINGCLFFLGVALLILGRPLDALTSTGVISLNILVSVIQEIRAKRTLDHIALLTRPMATVIRDGKERTVSPEELVVGDLLKIAAGDGVVVDGTVVGDGEITVDESQLTGESDLVPKQRGNPIYSGSFCATGTGYYSAEKVGAACLANQITSSARAFRRVTTPLQSEVHLVIRVVLLLVVYLEFLLFLNALQHRINLSESVQNSALIAALVPNGLFLSISVAYALAAVRIVRFGALVQQSNAVESLSNVDVLCMDKTGTLTANKLAVHSVLPITTTEADLKSILGDIVSSMSSGNKTSEAIAMVCPGRKRQPLVEISFSSARKWSAVAFDDEAGRGIYALGAAEMLRPYLQGSADPQSPQWGEIEGQISTQSDTGLRVILVVTFSDPAALHAQGDDSRLPEGMIPLGLVTLTDELRPEARETLQAFIKAGVQPKIISGDNPETVAALARQAGLGNDVRLVSGPELNEMSEDQFRVAASSMTIFGRITPQQKQRLVQALREAGHYVAMIGDGVNDVLSLKQAHLGIAMHSGSQAARGVADIVLLKDSFAVMVPAVAEGQRIINGMRDILKLFLTRISTIGILILSSMVIGQFPLAIRQGSVVTLLTVAIPTVLIAIWARPGPSPKGAMIQQLAHFVVSPALITSILGLLLFYGTLALSIQQAHGYDAGISAAHFAHIEAVQLPIARTALTSFLTLCGILLVIFVEPPTQWWTGGDVLSGDWRPTYLAIGLMLAFGIILTVRPLRHLFDLSPLGLTQLVPLLGALIVWLFLVRWMWRMRLLGRFLGVSTL